MALNATRAESDLSAVHDEKVTGVIAARDVRLARDVQTLERLIEDHRIGRSLGEALLWLALVLCLLEIGFANFKARPVTPLSTVLDAAPSGRITQEQSPPPQPADTEGWRARTLLKRLSERITSTS